MSSSFSSIISRLILLILLFSSFLFLNLHQSQPMFYILNNFIYLILDLIFTLFLFDVRFIIFLSTNFLFYFVRVHKLLKASSSFSLQVLGLLKSPPLGPILLYPQQVHPSYYYIIFSLLCFFSA